MDNPPAPSNPFADAPVIFAYTRKQAIEDGVLVDLTAWARETGFVIPVAATAAVWHQWLVPPPEARSMGQCERGRTHDLLTCLLAAIRSSANGQCVRFQVIFRQAVRHHSMPHFKAIIGPGDAGEPVLTILLPDED